MKRIIPFVVTAIFAATGGWFAARKFQDSRSHDTDASGEIARRQCPMHPWVKSDAPGACTICEMPLVATHAYGTNPDHSAHGIVMLPPGSPNILGLQTTEVKMQRLARTLRVAGMIGEDESRHGVICAPVEGRIDGLAMNHDGQPVSKRQPIATLSSRTLLAAANDYKLALPSRGAALEQARCRLEQCGLVAEQIAAIPQRQPDDLLFGILSPLTGTIVKSYVNEGQHVREGEKMFEIADFTRMWCMFTASEKDLPLVHERQVVRVRVESLPGEPINARVGFISPNLDAHLDPLAASALWSAGVPAGHCAPRVESALSARRLRDHAPCVEEVALCALAVAGGDASAPRTSASCWKIPSAA